jgi:hypothetical protein
VSTGAARDLAASGVLARTVPRNPRVRLPSRKPRVPGGTGDGGAAIRFPLARRCFLKLVRHCRTSFHRNVQSPARPVKGQGRPRLRHPSRSNHRALTQATARRPRGLCAACLPQPQRLNLSHRAGGRSGGRFWRRPPVGEYGGEAPPCAGVQGGRPPSREYCGAKPPTPGVRGSPPGRQLRPTGR